MLSLIGVVPKYPVISYDSTGRIDYHAATQAFDLVAVPLAFKLSASSPLRMVSAPREFQVHIQVDNAGQLVGGVAGPDLVLTGVIDVNGDGSPDLSGTLLTGEVTHFGFLNVGTTDRYDFRFTPTGGAMSSYYLGNDIAVTTTSENSTFTGSFAADFRGGAKGNVGTTPGDRYVLSADKCSSSQPYVMIVDRITGQPLSKFLAYEPNYRGGVRVATGDLTGDGVDEIITAPGRSHQPEIKVFQQDGTELTQFRFQAYADTFTGGVNVAVGDVDGDGKNDIVTSPSYGPSEVKVWRNLYDSAHPLADPVADTPYRAFLAFPSSFIGGSVVRVADLGTFLHGTVVDPLAPDGKGEIVVGNGAGMRSTVKVFDATASTPQIVRTFLPFTATFRGGVSLATAKVDASDLIPDVIVGAGTGGSSRVLTLDGVTGSVLSSFTAYTDASQRAPVRVAGWDSNKDGIADRIMTAQGTDGTSRRVRSFDISGALVDNYLESDPAFCGMYYLDVLHASYVDPAKASPAAATVTHQASCTEYTPGGTITVRGTVEYTGRLLSLRWQPILPDGWTFSNVTSNGTLEAVGGEIVWTGDLPASPISVAYVVSVPSGASGQQTLRSAVETLFSGQVDPAANNASPDPLIVQDHDRDPVVQAPATGSSSGNKLLLRLLRPDPLAPVHVQLTNQANGQVLFSQPQASLNSLTILGASSKADILTVDSSLGGAMSIPGGVIFNGGTGSRTDTLLVRGTAGSDTFSLQSDRVVLGSTAFVFTGVEQLRLEGMAGNDTYAIKAIAVPTTISDSGGVDTLDCSAIAAPVKVSLALTYSSQRIYSGANTLAIKSGLENVIGTAYGDTITGSSAANRIWGGGGNDTISGGSGNDVIFGGPGNDTLRGGSGNDLLFGEAGDDSLYGDSGNNVMLGGEGNDYLAGSYGRNVFIGGLGADNLRGNYSYDLLIGGPTSYDASESDLWAVLAEWSVGTNIDDRMRRLTDATGPRLIKGETVLDDAARDTLYGGSGSDWFFDFAGDEASDRGSSDR